MSDLNKVDMTPDVVKGTVDALRNEFKSTAAEQSAEFKRLSDHVERIESENQKLVKEIETEKKSREDFKEMFEKQMETFEKIASRPNADAAEKVEAKSNIKMFEQFVTRGLESMNRNADELTQKFLNTYVDAEGGVLTPPEYVQDIIKNITEIDNLRSVSRVRRAGSNRMEIPIRHSLVTVNWEGEYEEAQDGNSTYQLNNLPLNKIMVNVPITIEELQDSAFDMESEINMDVAEAFAQKEGEAFVTGDSIKKPQGFTQNDSVGIVNTKIADGVSMDSIIKIEGELKTGYNPIYVMNRKTMAYVKQLKESTSGRYLWQAGNIAAGVPNQLNGYGYLELPSMDDVGTNTVPIAFGDFRQGYLIGDGVEITVIRDPYTSKKKGVVEFTFMRRVGGQVIKPEAIKLLKCAVS